MAESDGVKTERPADESEIFINRSWRMNLLVPHHAKYCKRILMGVPDAFEEYDTQRMTFLHFAITSLDILNSIKDLKDTDKQRIIDWIYMLQVKGEPSIKCGFQGSSTFLLKNCPSETNVSEASSDLSVKLYSSHITMTYAALVTLITLGDDLASVNRSDILKGVSALQNSDGSFKASLGCSESDMRFVYCAVCISYILNDFSYINIPKLVEFIKKSFTYEGSFGSGAGTEGHAAYTFCAVASLSLMNKINEALSVKQVERLQKWCLFRQEYGFTGRPNKSEDTCYSYWVGATLALLECLQYSDRERNVGFVLSNQNPITGGIGKSDSEFVDPLHTFMGIAGLSLVNYTGLNAINPQLTMSENAVKRLKSLQSQWN